MRITSDRSPLRSQHRAPAGSFSPPPGLVLFLAAILSGGGLLAHDPGLSSVELRLDGSVLRGTLTLARADLAALDMASGALSIRSAGSTVLAEVGPAAESSGGAVSYPITIREVSGARFSLRSEVLPRLARGHRQWVSVKDAGGRAIVERLLDARSPEMEIARPADRTAAAEGRSTGSFFLLGVEHIWTGYDHIAFLLGVLLACRGLLDAAKIITSFSAAHSLTLALSTLGVIDVSPRIVEPLIAASIAYVGLENLLRNEHRRRWVLTFFFGLVHGLGFASALREMGVGTGSSGAAAPLILFNLGVESGQLAIAAAVLPLLAALRSRPRAFARSAVAFSAGVVLLGGALLVERLM